MTTPKPIIHEVSRHEFIGSGVSLNMERFSGRN